MKLSSILNEDYIVINGNLKNKEEIISFLIRQFERNYDFKIDSPKVINTIEERESLGGTVLPTGVWIPHGRLENFNDIIVSIYIPEEEFIQEGISVKMVVLFLIGKTTSNLYLKILSAFAQISSNESLFETILKSKDPRHFISNIEKAGFLLTKGSTVNDIMTKNVITLKPSDTLKTLSDLFYKNNISYIPVVDEKDEFIGEVTTLDLLKEGIPNYAMMLDNLSFLSTLDPFDKLLENEDTIQIKKIMNKPLVQLAPEASIIEATFEMTQHKRRQIPVVKDKKIVGVISYMDILKKILRG
ncbi:MAG: hypothetical protein A2015_06855 [Spirochaetes bacterium GWF1_31_7]|nr:MAG: hypothetical protein A2Y30_09605 [Spirochaetes bacterium GWE1_32_154]OHD46550.1 MAG: hypothetical protein A2015_06855 [Spirochaetes bacterium GWF1_31_7]OHD49359.1 MAG: hypothetical protein A2Y29_03850 [Spirochaetes bacterium GWE2_31_10]HBD93099.1 hypothetical protein [Spirochaetia bacterium]HBI36784.1 hypothetical protein [Spirochaetia bacterium]